MKYLFRIKCSYFRCIATDTDTQILFIHNASTFNQEIPALYLLGWLPLFIHITYHAVLFCRNLNPRRPEAASYRNLHRAYIRPCAAIKKGTLPRLITSAASVLVNDDAIPFLLYSGNTSIPICHIVSQSAEHAAKPIILSPSNAATPNTSSSFRFSQSALLHCHKAHIQIERLQFSLKYNQIRSFKAMYV